MPNHVYDKLKFVAQILLPALGTLYLTVAGIWSVPAADQVVSTIVAVDTFLGVLLGITTAQYNKGVDDQGALHVTPSPTGAKTFTLELGSDPEKLEEKNEVRLKVKTPDKA